MNAELCETWPNITEKKDPLPDAEDWAEVKNKRDHHNSIYVQRSDGVSADIGSVSCVKK